MSVKKKLSLDVGGLSHKNKQKAKNEVAQLITDATLEAVSEGKSPVKGERTWKELSLDYANKEKGGNRTPNMELSGDMLDALHTKISSPARNYVTIEIGGSESDKAESHNHHKGKGTNPRRRFIPGEDQGYKTDIQNEIKRIEAKYKARDQRQKAQQTRQRPEVTQPTTREGIDFTTPTDEFLNNTNLVDQLLAALDGR